jgi:hypothetical protein
MPSITAAQVQTYLDTVEAQFAHFLVYKDLLVDAIIDKGGTITYQDDPEFVAQYGPNIPVYEDLDDAILSIPNDACLATAALKADIDACGGVFIMDTLTNQTSSFTLNGVTVPFSGTRVKKTGATLGSIISTINTSTVIPAVIGFAGGEISSLSIPDKTQLNVFYSPYNGIINWSGVFSGCTTLTTVSSIDTSFATNISNLFMGCSALTALPFMNCTNVTNATDFVSGCSSLSYSDVRNMTVSHSYANCSLSALALNYIFSNLGTPSSTQNIDITGNPGAATCDTSIATAKNWTVTT